MKGVFRIVKAAVEKVVGSERKDSVPGAKPRPKECGSCGERRKNKAP